MTRFVTFHKFDPSCTRWWLQDPGLDSHPIYKAQKADVLQNIFQSFLLRLYHVFLCFYSLEFYPSDCHFLCTTETYSVLWFVQKGYISVQIFSVISSETIETTKKDKRKVKNCSLWRNYVNLVSYMVRKFYTQVKYRSPMKLEGWALIWLLTHTRENNLLTH